MIPQHFLMEKYLVEMNNKIGDYSPTLPNETNHYAIIVEPRIDYKILSVLKNHIYFLNEGPSNIKWGLQFFHGIENEEYIKDVTKNWKNIHFEKIEVKNFTKESYNKYFKSPDFWERVKGKKILTFQLDSLLLRHGVDEFLDYDYIGAPWTKPKEQSFIGNGGLSLRTKEKMFDISKKYMSSDPMWEDIFFTKYLKSTKLPDLETAMKFSVEDVFHPNPLGIHNPIKTPVYLVDLLLNKSISSFDL